MKCYCCKKETECELICVNYADSIIPFGEEKLIEKRPICRDCNHLGE